MAQSRSYWGYWLFMVALSLGSVALFRDFTIPVILLSIVLSPVISRRLDGIHWKVWILPCGFLFTLLLGSVYYAADLIFFPHSLRAAHRLQDACVQGTLWALFGLFANPLSNSRKNHAVNGTAIERRR